MPFTPHRSSWTYYQANQLKNKVISVFLGCLRPPTSFWDLALRARVAWPAAPSSGRRTPSISSSARCAPSLAPGAECLHRSRPVAAPGPEHEAQRPTSTIWASAAPWDDPPPPEPLEQALKRQERLFPCRRARVAQGDDASPAHARSGRHPDLPRWTHPGAEPNARGSRPWCMAPSPLRRARSTPLRARVQHPPPESAGFGVCPPQPRGSKPCARSPGFLPPGAWPLAPGSDRTITVSPPTADGHQIRRIECCTRASQHCGPSGACGRNPSSARGKNPASGCRRTAVHVLQTELEAGLTRERVTLTIEAPTLKHNLHSKRRLCFEVPSQDEDPTSVSRLVHTARK